MDCEYVLNRKYNFAFNSVRYVIKLGGKKESYDIFPQDKLLEFVSDSLTHEHIHKIIFNLFKDDVICKLFDAIQQYFRDKKLATEFMTLQGEISWDRFIEIHGFDEFLDCYCIDGDSLEYHFEKCNRRCKE